MTRWIDYPWLRVGAVVGCVLLVAGFVCAAMAVVETCRARAARRRSSTPPAAPAPSTQDDKPAIDFAIDFGQQWSDWMRLNPDVDSRLNRIARRARAHKEGNA